MKRITRSEIFIAMLSVLITTFIASCDFSEFAIPTSVTIKGTPGVRIPLGSPFVGENKDIVERYLGTDKIMEMMGGASEGEESSLSNIYIYEYAPPGEYGDEKAFIIHYPIAKMPYDLGVYMNQIYEIKPPKITGVDLRRPPEVSELFQNKPLSELMKLTSGEIRDAIDAKIDGWVDQAARGKDVDTDIPAAQSVLNNLSTALKNPLLTDPQKEALIAETKANIKALPEVKEAKDTAVDQFTELQSKVRDAGGLEQKIEIPLGDITKLVKYIEVKETGLKVMGGTEAFEGKIGIAIPQFGIGTENSYETGTDKDGDLYFTTNDGEGDPSIHEFKISPDEPNLTIYITILDFIEGPVDFAPSLEFDWTVASVDPGEHGKLTGTYEMDFGNIKDFLGDNFEPPKVMGYLYVSDLPISKENSANRPTVLLRVGSDGKPDDKSDDEWYVLTKDEEEMDNADLPQFPAENGGLYTETLPKASLHPIDMADIFEAPVGSVLEYTVLIGAEKAYTLVNETDSLEGEISADMVIVIPLAFKVTTTIPITVDGKSYVPLALKNEDGESLLPEIEEDLFGRDGKGGTVDEVIGYISGVSIKMENFINEALPNAAILIKSGASDHLLELSSGDDSKHTVLIDDNDVKYPFTPEFKILIPCAEGETYGILSIGRKYDFDFNLVVEATADLNKTIDF